MMSKQTRRESVLREFPPVGKYRVRLVEAEEGQAKSLDIREYVANDTFEGFTRRGIRLSGRAQLEVLRDTISELLEVLRI